MLVRVRCTFEIDVEFPDDTYPDYLPLAIEDSGCPGTGRVGAAVMALIEKHEEASTCWACASCGENKILAINGVAASDSAAVVDPKSPCCSCGVGTIECQPGGIGFAEMRCHGDDGKIRCERCSVKWKQRQA